MNGCEKRHDHLDQRGQKLRFPRSFGNFIAFVNFTTFLAKLLGLKSFEIDKSCVNNKPWYVHATTLVSQALSLGSLQVCAPVAGGPGDQWRILPLFGYKASYKNKTWPWWIDVGLFLPKKWNPKVKQFCPNTVKQFWWTSSNFQDVLYFPFEPLAPQRRVASYSLRACERGNIVAWTAPTRLSFRKFGIGRWIIRIIGSLMLVTSCYIENSVALNLIRDTKRVGLRISREVNNTLDPPSCYSNIHLFWSTFRFKTTDFRMFGRHQSCLRCKAEAFLESPTGRFFSLPSKFTRMTGLKRSTWLQNS